MIRRRYLDPIRNLLRRLPDETKLPILSGRNQGAMWHPHSFNLGAWGGWYETRVQRCFEEYIRPGMVVYDCGAAVGFFTLLATRLAGGPSRVFAIEPCGTQIRWLQKNLGANGLQEVRILPVAVSDRNGMMSFRESCSTGSGGSLQEGGAFSVVTRTLDCIADEYGAPDFLKIDVETGEVAALRGASRLLAGKRPVICMEHHGRALFQACQRILEAAGYAAKLLEGDDDVGKAVWIPRR